MKKEIEDQIIRKFNELIIGSRNRFIEQISDTGYIERKNKLIDTIVRDHINGKRTIGCFYCNGGTKFMVFDIDEVDDVRAPAIITILKRLGIKDYDIHLESSGNKGFHIWLFFDQTLPIKKIVDFGHWVISQLGEYASKIELRPESIKGKGIKLPLGIHKKTKKKTVFLNHNRTKIRDQTKYFLNIKPMPKDDFMKLIDVALTYKDVRTLERLPPESTSKRLTNANEELKDIKIPINQKSSIKKLAMRLITEGISQKDINEGNGRHSLQFYVALHYKDEGYSKDEVIQLVTDWALIQKQNGMAESSEDHIKRDVYKDVTHIFKYDKGIYDSRGRPFELYESDVLYASQFKNASARKIMLALLIWGRIYHKNGVFFIDMRTLEEISGITKKTICKYIYAFDKDGAITILEKGSYGQHKSNEYYISQLVIQDNKINGVEVASINDVFQYTYKLVEHKRAV